MNHANRDVQITLPDCAGVTDVFGRHHTADKKGVVNVDAQTADRLQRSHAVRPPQSSFLIGASWQPETRLNLWHEDAPPAAPRPDDPATNASQAALDAQIADLLDIAALPVN